MQNQIFNLKRFLAYSKYMLLINWKKKALTATGLIIALIVTIVFNLKTNRGHHWNSTIAISAIVVLIIVFANAFTSFRQKESTMHFLTIPASNIEKFGFELLSRFFTYLVIFPVLLKSIGNFTIKTFVKIEDSIRGIGQEQAYKLFSFEKFLENKFALILLVIITVSIIIFTGTTVFKKNPFLKTLLFTGGIIGSISLYFLILAKRIMPNMMNSKHLFSMPSKISPETWSTIGHVALVAFCIWCLSYGFFKLKEKEI